MFLWYKEIGTYYNTRIVSCQKECPLTAGGSLVVHYASGDCSLSGLFHFWLILPGFGVSAIFFSFLVFLTAPMTPACITRLLSRKELSQLLGVSVRQVDRERAKKRLGWLEIGGIIRFSMDQVTEYLKLCRRPHIHS